MLIVPSSRCIYLPPKMFYLCVKQCFPLFLPIWFMFSIYISLPVQPFSGSRIPFAFSPPSHYHSLDRPSLEHVAHCLTPIRVVTVVSLLLLLERWSWFSVVNTWAYCVSQCFAMVPHHHEQSQSFSYVAYHSLCLCLLSLVYDSLLSCLRVWVSFQSCVQSKVVFHYVSSNVPYFPFVSYRSGSHLMR